MAASKELAVAVAQLCKTCRQLENFDKTLDPQIGRLDGELWTLDDQWPDVPLLEASAKDECDFCRLLRESLRPPRRTIRDGLRPSQGCTSGCSV